MKKLFLILILPLAACGIPEGAIQAEPATKRGIQSLIIGCTPHDGIKSYSFKDSYNKAWTAICEDNTIIITEGE